MYCGVHIQSYDPETLETHVPPFIQGFTRHDGGRTVVVTAMERITPSVKCFYLSHEINVSVIVTTNNYYKLIPLYSFVFTFYAILHVLFNRLSKTPQKTIFL